MRFWIGLVGSVWLLGGCDGGPMPMIDAGRDAGDDAGATDVCAGREDGTSCGEALVCSEGACVPEGECGNAIVEGVEECDDGNTTAFDGCELDCTSTCDGDAACDNALACDGVETCGATGCVAGTPPGDATPCTLAGGEGVCRGLECVVSGCGNLVVEPDESCDDGNDTTRDGCEIDCRFTCEAVDPSMMHTWYLDCDADGYAGIGALTRTQCLRPAPESCGGGWTLRIPVAGAADCNDTDAQLRPGAPEVCDGEDNDCDGAEDEGVLLMFFLDVDGDAHGNASSSITGCSMPAGYVAVGDDCDDANPDRFPGNVEECDDREEDCDGVVDDGGNGCGGVCALEYPPGMPCDGADTDVCEDDTAACAGLNDSTCSAGANNVEVCDGDDDDCDGTIDEGSANGCGGACSLTATLGAPCDGPDSDMCSDDMIVCSGLNAAVCATGDDDVETCNTGDDDCDGLINEGACGARAVCSAALSMCIPGNRVFVSADPRSPAFGSLDAADAHCQSLANAAQLGGTWRAWMSASGVPVNTRFTRGSGMYIQLDGSIVANTWADLTDGTIDTPINLTQNHTRITGGEVWTGTSGTGSVSGGNCSSWTSAATGATASVGVTSAFDNDDWTNIYAQSCSRTNVRVYCFEQ
jgi:cysteine-rich repeat protein